ncbi:uncharacterized protein AruCF_4123 [Achromobacter ruhlandii]|nr:uncharacterized protein AruCF_4123 [Achromobacter ruhlandii]
MLRQSKTPRNEHAPSLAQDADNVDTAGARRAGAGNGF